MSELSQKILEVAIEEIEAGAGEIGENNSGPWVEKYLNGIVESPANWCCGFICWCINEAFGILRNYAKLNVLEKWPWIPEYTLSARNLFRQFIARDAIREGDEIPEPGDLIFFWRESPASWLGHVGIVEKVNGFELLTIQGNTGNFPSKVKRIKYQNWKTIKTLLGFGRL